MVEQIKAEIRKNKKQLTLITLISAYILFIAISTITQDLFLGLLFGSSTAFFILMKISFVKLKKIMSQIDELSNLETIMVESSISFLSSILFIISYFCVIKICLIIAPHSTDAPSSIGLTFVFFSLLLTSINGAYDWKNVGKYNSQVTSYDEYKFSDFNCIEQLKPDIWHDDPNLIGNPIYVKSDNNSY